MVVGVWKGYKNNDSHNIGLDAFQISNDQEQCYGNYFKCLCELYDMQFLLLDFCKS